MFGFGHITSIQNKHSHQLSPHVAAGHIWTFREWSAKFEKSVTIFTRNCRYCKSKRTTNYPTGWHNLNPTSNGIFSNNCHQLITERQTERITNSIDIQKCHQVKVWVTISFKSITSSELTNLSNPFLNSNLNKLFKTSELGRSSRVSNKTWQDGDTPHAPIYHHVNHLALLINDSLMQDQVKDFQSIVLCFLTRVTQTHHRSPSPSPITLITCHCFSIKRSVKLTIKRYINNNTSRSMVTITNSMRNIEMLSRPILGNCEKSVKKIHIRLNILIYTYSRL